MSCQALNINIDMRCRDDFSADVKQINKQLSILREYHIERERVRKEILRLALKAINK